MLLYFIETYRYIFKTNTLENTDILLTKLLSFVTLSSGAPSLFLLIRRRRRCPLCSCISQTYRASVSAGARPGTHLRGDVIPQLQLALVEQVAAVSVAAARHGTRQVEREVRLHRLLQLVVLRVLRTFIPVGYRESARGGKLLGANTAKVVGR